MKVQCPACREIVAMEVFTTSSQGLRFCCTECGRITFLDNPDNLDAQPDEPAAAEPVVPPEAGRTEAQPAPDERTCPKCGHAQAGGQSCNKCGLDFLRFDPENLPPDPPEATDLWARLIDHPQDEALHERFIQACNQAGRLDFATRQYRILSRRPGLAAVAERMRARIVSLAQAQIASATLTVGPNEGPKLTSRIIMWVVLVLAMSGLAYLIYSSSEMLKKLY